ncbi:MAG: hypothetical protein ACI8WB_003429 [Phenylobacterium sp.]|jgi:hypothetical protein
MRNLTNNLSLSTKDTTNTNGPGDFVGNNTGGWLLHFNLVHCPGGSHEDSQPAR